MRESSIESKFRDEVKEVGGMAYKFVSPGNAGVPDRVVILQGGKSGFVELKRPGEKTTPLQKVQIRKILATGCYATVLDNKLPSSLQRSELIFFINISLLNNPSAPNGISLNK